MSGWEHDFYSRLAGDIDGADVQAAARAITGLRGMAADYYRRLTALEHAGMDTVERTWLSNLSDMDFAVAAKEDRSGQASELRRSLQSARHKYEGLLSGIGAGLDLIS